MERQEELHELGEIHRRIVDNVASGLLSVDGRGRILSFNAEAERITARPLPPLSPADEAPTGPQ